MRKLNSLRTPNILITQIHSENKASLFKNILLILKDLIIPIGMVFITLYNINLTVQIADKNIETNKEMEDNNLDLAKKIYEDNLILNRESLEANLDVKYFEIFYNDISSQDTSVVNKALRLLDLMNPKLAKKAKGLFIATRSDITKEQIDILNLKMANHYYQKSLYENISLKEEFIKKYYYLKDCINIIAYLNGNQMEIVSFDEIKSKINNKLTYDDLLQIVINSNKILEKVTINNGNDSIGIRLINY